MIIYDKKRTVYALITGVIVILLFIFVWIPMMYEWQQRKNDPFNHLSIYQENNTIKVFSPAWTLSWEIVQIVDKNMQKIIFTLTWSNEEIKSINEFPVNWLIGYDMCYKNKYGEYCFWKTK